MLKLREVAEREIRDAYKRYESQCENLGKSFVLEVESRMKEIEINPYLYVKVYKDVRRSLCRRFPYTVYFIATGLDIVVIGVLHQKRSPNAWRSRNSGV